MVVFVGVSYYLFRLKGEVSPPATVRGSAVRIDARWVAGLLGCWVAGLLGCFNSAVQTSLRSVFFAGKV